MLTMSDTHQKSIWLSVSIRTLVLQILTDQYSKQACILCINFWYHMKKNLTKFWDSSSQYSVYLYSILSIFCRIIRHLLADTIPTYPFLYIVRPLISLTSMCLNPWKSFYEGKISIYWKNLWCYSRMGSSLNLNTPRIFIFMMCRERDYS